MSTGSNSLSFPSLDSSLSPRPRTIWVIDPAHSFVEFGVKHLVLATVRGRFTGVSGTIVLDDADLTESAVNVEIDAGSVDTQDLQRDTHLLSADFLDVDRSPVIRFASTRIEHAPQDRLRVRGDLTIRGATRPVVLDASLLGRTVTPDGEEAIAYSAETTINRHDFGLTWNMLLETGGFVVGDTVQISINGQANKPAV